MSDGTPTQSISMCDGSVRAWIEQETVHIKIVDSYGDPVELAEHEVTSLISALTNLLASLHH